jgi:hypothetical protein
MLNPLIDQWLADLHQADLLSEAGKHRPARSGRAAGDGLWERLVAAWAVQAGGRRAFRGLPGELMASPQNRTAPLHGEGSE